MLGNIRFIGESLVAALACTRECVHLGMLYFVGLDCWLSSANLSVGYSNQLKHVSMLHSSFDGKQFMTQPFSMFLFIRMILLAF